MITAYNKYINTKTLNEKLDIDLPTSINDVNTKVTKSFDKVKNKIFMDNTSDGYEINPDEEYYAVVQYKIDPDKLKENSTAVMNDKIFWATLKLTLEESFYKYQIVGADVNVPKEHGSILDEDNKQYIKIVKSPLEKIPVNRINGFYLYKVKSDINMVLNNYHVKYDKKNIEEPVENAVSKTPDVKIGKVYEITSSKGNQVNVRITKKEGDSYFGVDIDTNKLYPDMTIDKFKNVKEINPYKYIKSKLEALKWSNWKTSDSFKEIANNNAEAIKFITKKWNKLGYYKKALLAWKKYKLDSGTEPDDAIIGGVDAAYRSADNMQNIINNELRKGYGVDLKKKEKEKESTENSTEEPTGEKTIEKPTEEPKENVEVEPVEDKTETEEEVAKKEEVKAMDNKAQEVQTDIQNKEEKPKTVKKPIKQKKTPVGTPESEKVKEDVPQLVQASKNYNEFINGKNKRL